MKVQIIAEGPTDREILIALLLRLAKEIDMKIDFIEESKTQRKRRGNQSILFDYETFAKFLHNGYSKSVNIIIICVDNDGSPLDCRGIGSEKKEALNKQVKKFIDKNRCIYTQINPKFIIVVPVETIDYWMNGVGENTSDCKKIIKIEKINRDKIKIETYGKSNVYAGWIIDEDALKQKIEIVKKDSHVIDKLRCFPGFRDFEDQLKLPVNPK